MKKLSLGTPSSPNDLTWIVNALKTIERASITDMQNLIATDYTVTGTYTPTRTLNASTATLPDVIAFLATLITDIQKGGMNRTGA